MSTPLAVADWGGPDRPFRLDTRHPIIHRLGTSFGRDRLWEYAGGHVGFYGWLCVVNRRIEHAVMVGLMDLPDRCWRDEYDDRVPPGEAADLSLDEAAAEFGGELP